MKELIIREIKKSLKKIIMAYNNNFNDIVKIELGI